MNETTAFEYDLKNRLKKVIYPDTNFITYTYDLAGRRTAMTDARNNTTTYGYDNAYRLTSMTDALNHSTVYGYDLMSNLTAVTDTLSQQHTFTYDAHGRELSQTRAGSTMSFEYDAVGNRIKRTDYTFYPPHVILETVFAGPQNLVDAENISRKAREYYKGAPMPSNFFPK